MEEGNLMILKNLVQKSTFLTLVFFLVVMSLFFPILSSITTYLLGIYFLYYLLSGEIKIPINTGMIILFLLVFTYFWGIFLSGGVLYQLNKSEIRNIAFIFVLLLVIGPITTQELNKFIDKLARFMSITIPIVSLFSLYKLSLLNKGIYLDFLFRSNGRYPSGTSLITDYNMFSLGIFVGLILIIRNYFITNSTFMEIYYLICINIVVLTLLLTGSRRAFVVLVIVLIYFTIVSIKKLKTSKNKVRTILIIISFFAVSFNFFDQLTSDGATFTEEFERVFNRYETISNADEGLSSRSSRWEYAFEIISEGNLNEFIFGQGFGYLKLYQNRFSLSHEDYPHNFLLSAFISSGMIGFLITFSLLIYILIKIIKLIRNERLDSNLLLIFILILTFLSISGNMIISVKVFPVFIIYILLISSKEPLRFQTRRTINIQ